MTRPRDLAELRRVLDRLWPEPLEGWMRDPLPQPEPLRGRQPPPAPLFCMGCGRDVRDEMHVGGLAGQPARCIACLARGVSP